MGKDKKKKKHKSMLHRKLKCSLDALLSTEPAVFGVSDKVRTHLSAVAKHVTSNPSIQSNTRFYVNNVLTCEKKVPRSGKQKPVPYTEQELENNAQNWLTYTIGSLIRRGIIKQTSTFERIS